MARVENPNLKTADIEKSRLGRLLVNRGHISSDQLSSALERQRVTGLKLGELLVADGVITERDLARTLKQQKRTRYAAAFAALAVAPLQPALGLEQVDSLERVSSLERVNSLERLNSLAASAPEFVMHQLSVIPDIGHTHLEPLSDSELRTVQARGSDATVAGLNDLMTTNVEVSDEGTSLDALELLMRGLVPITHLLDADVKLQGVHYRAGEQPVRLLPNGKVQMMLPQQIERISMENIRASGSAHPGVEGPSLGHIYISDLRFSEGSSLIIYPH